MKKLLLVAFVAFGLSTYAQDFPQPSPLAKTYQMVGLNEIEIEYSSPGVKGREIFGDLVPFDRLWRTGANMATVISFSQDCKFGEISVPAGEYALFTLPSSEKIGVILNKNTDQGGTGDYDEHLNVGQFVVDFNKTKGQSVERMIFTFQNTTSTGTELKMEWADRSFVIPITVATEAAVLGNMKSKLDEYSGEYRIFNSVANFYLEQEDGAKAVEMAEKSVELEKKFWNVHTLAKAYKMNGQKDQAIETAKLSMELAEKAKYQPYIDLNQKLIKELGGK